MPAGDSEGTQRAYRLLLEVMGTTERAALGRFVLRTKENLVLIRAREGRLGLTTLRFHDEGETAKPPEREAAPSAVPDLMTALEETLAEIKSGDRRTPAAAGRR